MNPTQGHWRLSYRAQQDGSGGTSVALITCGNKTLARSLGYAWRFSGMDARGWILRSVVEDQLRAQEGLARLAGRSGKEGAP
jgi:hypothetical protein